MDAMRVLVAEDHVLLARRIAEGLRDAGLAVDVAHDGAAALTQGGVTAQHWPRSRTAVGHHRRPAGHPGPSAPAPASTPPGAPPACHPPTRLPRHDQPTAPEAALAATSPGRPDWPDPDPLLPKLTRLATRQQRTYQAATGAAAPSQSGALCLMTISSGRDPRPPRLWRHRPGRPREAGPATGRRRRRTPRTP